jgi:hypothetical protein
MTTGIVYSPHRAVVVVEGATVDLARRNHHQIIIGIVLGFVGLAYLCWLLFALPVHTLPLLTAVAVWLAAYHTGSGSVAATIVGAVAGSVILLVGHIAFTALWSPSIR